MSDINKSRRVFLRTAALGVAAAPLARFATHAPAAQAAKPHAENGHALNYVNNASNSDHPRHKDGNQCSKCVFWAGDNSGDWGTCRHPQFAGVQVNKNGWCSSFAPAG